MPGVADPAHDPGRIMSNPIWPAANSRCIQRNPATEASHGFLGVSCICLVFVGSVEMLDRGRARVRAQRNLGSD